MATKKTAPPAPAALDYDKMTYLELDELWGKMNAERLLATGTPRFAELAAEQEEVRRVYDRKVAEFNTPERQAKAQRIGFGPTK